MSDGKLPEVGATLKIDGEKEFKNALSEISRQMSVAASESKLTSAQYAENKNSIEALTAQSENYSKKAELQRDKIEVLSKALQNAEEVYGKNSKQAERWQIQLNKATAELINTENAAKKNTEAIEQLNEKSSAVEKLGTFFDDLAKKAEKAAEKSTGLPGLKKDYEKFQKAVEKIKDEHFLLVGAAEKAKKAASSFASGGLKAVAGFSGAAATGVTAVAAAATAASKGLYDAAHEAAQAGDAIDEASQRMGTSAETYQELSYAAKMSGVDVSTLETAAKKLQSTGSSLDLSQAINQVASIKDESARTEKAIELFGSKAAYSMGPMLEQGTKKITELKEQAQSLGLVMSDESVNASATFNDSLDNLTGTLSAVKNNISAQFLPGITEVMDGVTGLFTGDESAAGMITDGIENFADTADVTVNIVAGIFEQLAETTADIAPEILDTLIDCIGTNLPKLGSSALSIVSTLAESLLTEENIGSLTSTAASLVTQLAGFLIDSSPLVIDSAFNLITGFADGLLEDDNLEKIATSAVDLIGNLAIGLIDNLPELISATADICGALWSAIKDYDWWGLAKSIFLSLKDSIKRMFTGDDNSDDDPKPHAGGIGYIPYDGYIAELHRGERVLSAAQAATEHSNSSDDIRQLEKKLDELSVTVNEAPVNVNFYGSSAALGRNLDVVVSRENRRKTAFKEDRNA